MKKRISVLLIMALLTMAALGGCAGGTDISSGDNSSVESQTGSTDGSSEDNASAASQAESSESSQSQAGSPVYGGSIVVGIQQDVDSLDPHKATAAGTKEILFNIFEGLVKPDENGDLMNALASDYTISEDGLVYTFTLREGVKFHNGNTVTAQEDRKSVV